MPHFLQPDFWPVRTKSPERTAARDVQKAHTSMPDCYKEGSPVTCAKDYSYLSATIGSTFIARRAGM